MCRLIDDHQDLGWVIEFDTSVNLVSAFVYTCGLSLTLIVIFFVP